MPPNQIPATQATTQIRMSVNTLPTHSEACNCGWYGFRSNMCAHRGVELAVQCGKTISETTNHPIFCMKGALKITLPDYVVTRLCSKCQFNESLANANKRAIQNLDQNQTQTSPASKSDSAPPSS